MLQPLNCSPASPSCCLMRKALGSQQWQAQGLQIWVAVECAILSPNKVSRKSLCFGQSHSAMGYSIL